MTTADLRLVSAAPLTRLLLGRRAFGSLGGGKAPVLVERNLMVYRRLWLTMVSGFFEPVFYLLSIGVGLGKLTGAIDGVPYAHYVAPGLLAVSAMNGAVYDSTWNVFFKMHFGKLYDAMLATSLGPLDVALGEISYALLRGALYAGGFLTVMTAMGLTTSWAALLALPAAVLVAFGFASLGMAITSYMKTFQQMDWINFVMLPMFLFSATFYPVTVYPGPVQGLVKALPLWHGVELIRGLTTGAMTGALWGHVAYYVVMIALGVTFTTRRLRTMFLR